ncbi:hypothetical protein MRB53_021297 [Persea americana]|uniref:Uncharacterized protein n=1 Tax=Persea americana TaxID=3435 RepID=A0ACC2L3I4_PERAE|nr:hypothetical protein MRB53_021297 [Persea americana]
MVEAADVGKQYARLRRCLDVGSSPGDPETESPDPLFFLDEEKTAQILSQQGPILVALQDQETPISSSVSLMKRRSPPYEIHSIDRDSSTTNPLLPLVVPSLCRDNEASRVVASLTNLCL